MISCSPRARYTFSSDTDMALKENDDQLVNVRLDGGKPSDAVAAQADLATFQPSGKAVSTVFDIPSSPAFKVVRRALQVIDRVHGDGDLERVTVQRERLVAATRAGYDPNTKSIIFSSRIDIRASDVVHETFHVLDDMAFEAEGKSSQQGSWGVLAGVLNEIKSSSLWSITRAARFEELRTVTRDQFRVVLFPESSANITYINADEEWLARAYVQYIAVRSGDAELLREVGDLRSTATYQRSYDEAWSDSEFKPIAATFDRVLQDRRWVL